MARFYSSNLPEVEVRRLYCEMGLSTQATAAVLGCTDAAVRRRLVQLGIPRRAPWEHNAVMCDPEEVRRLYVKCGLSTIAVAAQIGVSEGVVRRRLEAMGVRRRGVGKLRYARRDFDGDTSEKAYLIGFRLNRTFDFLLPKEDCIPDWILPNDQTFFAFFAGYVDAEGYIQTALPPGYRTPQVRLDIRAYDCHILQQLVSGLQRYGIACPPARPRVGAGYANKAGVRSNRELWGISVNRTDALLLLSAQVLPQLRHARRRQQLERALEVLSSKAPIEHPIATGMRQQSQHY